MHLRAVRELFLQGDKNTKAFHREENITADVQRLLTDCQAVRDAAPRWIAVGDRLPEVEGMYLTVFCVGEKQLFDTYRFISGDWRTTNRRLIEAWMPIPPYGG